MNPAITITEIKTNDEEKKIIISGADSHDAARNAAEKWCEEHNTRILDFIVDPNSLGQGDSQIYYAVFGSGDGKLQQRS